MSILIGIIRVHYQYVESVWRTLRDRCVGDKRGMRWRYRRLGKRRATLDYVLLL